MNEDFSKAAAQAKSELHKTYDDISPYEMTNATSYNDGYSYDPNSRFGMGRTFTTGPNDSTSIKSNYSRDDYNQYNPNEAISRDTYKKIKLSMLAYDNVGIVRNVIDLMSDFTCKGIKIVHPNVAEQKFFDEWWNYIDGDMISERFVNYLYRMGNVPVNISYGKVPVRIENKWMKSSANSDVLQKFNDISIKEPVYENRRIPLRFTFVNPLSLEVISPELAVFTGKYSYALRVNQSLKTALLRAQAVAPNASYKELLQLIPSSISSAVQQGKTLIPLDGTNLNIYYYRKDDWEIWAKPMISSILDDLVMLEKMKLADISALNGAISNVRLWRVGRIEGDNPNNWIIPLKAHLAKVRNILANNVGGGTLDVVWGPDIDFKESNTQVHHFLGFGKFEAVFANIYSGLGVPFGASGGNGMTNSFIQMQTFVERLEYGRRVLQNFWIEQIKKVQLAMGYSKPAQIVFSQINLGDDTTYKQLLINLVDRDIISADAVADNFGFNYDIESVKIKRDYKKRESGKVPPKAGAFHNPQLDKEHDMRKIVLQRGGVAPSEVGLELLARKPGEQSPNEQQADLQMKQLAQEAKYKPKIDGGRPSGAKDGGPRKMKKPPVQTKAAEFMNTFMWAYDAQKKISDIVTPLLVSGVFNKANVRSLSVEEKELLELAKFQILCATPIFTEVNEEEVLKVTKAGLKDDMNISSAAKLLIHIFKTQNKREPSLDEMHQIQSSAIALANEEADGPIEAMSDIDGVTSTELEMSQI